MEWSILCIGYGLVFCVIAIIIFLFSLFTKTTNRNLLFLVSGVLLFEFVLSLIPEINYIWFGRILCALCCLLFVCLFSSVLTKEESGIAWKVRKSSWVPFLILCIIGSGIWMIGEDLESLSDKFDTGKILYQSIVLGIFNEFIYRGVILGLLNKVFVSRVKVFGASVGWGLLVQAIIFAIVYSFSFDESLHFYFLWAPVISAGILGLVTGWLREKSGSIILPILFYSLSNLFLYLFYLIFVIIALSSPFRF